MRMAAPAIELRWGANWPAREKTYSQSIFEEALDITRSAALNFELETSIPKAATFVKMHPWHDSLGEAISATDFKLFIEKQLVRNRRLEQIIKKLGVVGFHEYLHCVRQETHYALDIVEFTATEGIAHIGEAELGTSIDMHDYISEEDCIPAWTSQEIMQHTDMLYKDVAAQRKNCVDLSVEDPFHDKWFNDDIEGFETSLGVALGIHHVRMRILEGANLSSLVSQPAEEIIQS